MRSFLEARGIELPLGLPSDPPDAETIHALGKRKNELVLELIRAEGSSHTRVRFGSWRGRGVWGCVGRSCLRARTARTGLWLLVWTISSRPAFDGVAAEWERLAGKPAPDTFLAGARALRTGPAQGAMFQDALAGVEAARAGGFSWVVGVDRTGQAEALRRHGADVVAEDLGELLEER